MTTPSTGSSSGSPSDADSPQASFDLMRIVIVILGLALLGLVAAVIALSVQGKDIPSAVNTLTSLIAGGLVGFLTPHVKALTSSGNSGNAANAGNAGNGGNAGGTANDAAGGAGQGS